MDKNSVLEIFKNSGALLKGHFVLSSGLHSGGYLQCALVLQHPDLAAKMCSALAAKFKDKKIDLVIGPALGGVIVSYEVARTLGCRSIFSERREDHMQLKRGFTIKEGERVLVVEDVVTTGGSTNEVVHIVEDCGGKTVGIGAIINRSGKRLSLAGLKVKSLLEVSIPTYKLQQCPLCKKGIPLEKPGSKNS